MEKNYQKKDRRRLQLYLMQIEEAKAAEEAGFALGLGEGWGYNPQEYERGSVAKGGFRRGLEKALRFLFSSLNLAPEDVPEMDRYVKAGYCYGDAALLTLAARNRWLPDKLEYMMKLREEAIQKGLISTYGPTA